MLCKGAPIGRLTHPARPRAPIGVQEAHHYASIGAGEECAGRPSNFAHNDHTRNSCQWVAAVARVELAYSQRWTIHAHFKRLGPVNIERLHGFRHHAPSKLLPRRSKSRATRWICRRSRRPNAVPIGL